MLQSKRAGRSGSVTVMSDLSTIAVLAVVWAAAVAPPAYAYIDPSVMTYTIQALAGVAVALTATLGVVFRRTRRWLFRRFNIDENAHKAVDPAVAELNPGSPDYSKHLEQARESARELDRQSAGQEGKDLSWRGRFVCALLVCGFLCFSVLFVAPFEIMASNTKDLVASIADVWWVCALLAAACTIVSAIVCSVMRGRAYDTVLMLVFSLGVGCWVEAMFLNVGLPAADGFGLRWERHLPSVIISTLVWAALVCVPLYLSRGNRARWRKGIMLGCVTLLFVQGVGLASLAASGVVHQSSMSKHSQSYHTTEDGLFELSPKKNVVVFVLDTYDVRDIRAVVKRDEHFLDPMTGFTYYYNTTCAMIPTRYAVPFLLTNSLPKEGEVWKKYLNRRYRSSTLLDDIHDAGYSIGIYSDSDFLNYDKKSDRRIADETVNIHDLEIKIDPIGAAKVLTKCALYRDMPWLIKQRFWFYTDEVNNKMIKNDSSVDPGEIPYLMNDEAYYDALQERGISLTDTSGKTGAFRFIHLLGMHRPIKLNKNGDYVRRSKPVDQARGSMRIVFDYLQKLKELGKYDDTAIVVTADHGKWQAAEEFNYTSSPIVFYKPAGASGDKLRWSDAPISHCDVPPTVIAAIGGDSGKYGQTVYEVEDPGRVRYYDYLFKRGNLDAYIGQYELGAGLDPLKLEDWKPTGVRWQIN